MNRASEITFTEAAKPCLRDLALENGGRIELANGIIVAGSEGLEEATFAAYGDHTALRIPQAITDAVNACARGCYQRDLLDGDHTWSGSSLRGRARDYGARYRDSRWALSTRIENALRRLGASLEWHGGTAHTGPERPVIVLGPNRWDWETGERLEGSR